jgi:alpha,alpha-trehalase
VLPTLPWSLNNYYSVGHALHCGAKGPLKTKRHFRGHSEFTASLLCLSMVIVEASAVAQDTAPRQHGLDTIQTYIASGWDVLTRSITDCNTIVDPKLPTASVLYVPAGFEVSSEMQQLERRCNVRVQHLPKVIHRLAEIDPGKIDPGLLYLKNRYVVPGGRFNEMYGWDSYFIIRGLIRDQRIDLAQGMVENFFFEIEHYGAVLNANRTYYLTRSQPPFLTSMILTVYDALKAAGRPTRSWLKHAYEYAIKDHELWTHALHLAGSTGLSRYYDFGNGPAPESLQDETGNYRQAAAYFLLHPSANRNYIVVKSANRPALQLIGPHFTLQICDTSSVKENPACDSAGTVSLSSDYYKGDRSMRESGFDISFRFGPYGAATHHYAPVCLNSLLYKAEKDLEFMSAVLGRKHDTEEWRQRAEDRKARIQQYLWDVQRGMYFDYDFANQQRSSYEYITTFFPLWAGIATAEQARAVLQHLGKFEKPGSLVMSTRETGGQWDYPYAWAPTELLAVEGMRRYGFRDQADRVSYEFLSTVVENFRRDGTIREKYNAVTRSSETQVTTGYHTNVVGFGWTNGVFLELLHQLPEDVVKHLADQQITVPEH